MTQEQSSERSTLQLGWGIVLVLAGIGVIYRIPQVLPKLAHIETFAKTMWLAQFGSYLLAFLLIGGGARKLIRHFTSKSSENQDEPTDR